MAQAKNELIRENKLENMTEIIKAFAHPVRLQMINIFMKEEKSVGELANTIGTLQSQTSQQLSILKYRDVLKSRRNGNVVYYSIKNNNIRNIMDVILKEIY